MMMRIAIGVPHAVRLREKPVEPDPDHAGAREVVKATSFLSGAGNRFRFFV